MGDNLDAPSIALRFKDYQVRTIEEHNKLIAKHGSSDWGLWLKEFEDMASIREHLNRLSWPQAVYFVDSTDKALPVFYTATVDKMLTAGKVRTKTVPEYYRKRPVSYAVLL